MGSVLSRVSKAEEDGARKKICIIGAGPCGLSQLQAFATYNQSVGQVYFGCDADENAPFEVVCFEEKPSWGGQWSDTLDPASPSCCGYDRGYLYRNEWSTNGPKECLEFADYSFRTHFGYPTPSFPSRETIFHYLSQRSEARGVREFIRFNSAVRWTSFDEKRSCFMVQVEDLLTSETSIHEFDYLIVATGHFTCQNIPHIEGLETFWGPVIHVHDFADPEEYREKDVLLVGSGCSATNVCLECLGHGVASITISYRTDPCAIEMVPDIMEEKPVLVKMEGNTAVFGDYSRKEIDAIILCTGYLHKFPFLEGTLKLRTGDSLCPPGLYQGIVWINNPRLFYLGMQEQHFSFTLFDAQAWWVRDVLLGAIALPNRDDMLKHTCQVMEKANAAEGLGFSHRVRFQADYVRDLVSQTDYPYFDIDQVVRNFDRWEEDKKKSIIGYRDRAYVSAVDGTVGTLPTFHHKAAMFLPGEGDASQLLLHRGEEMKQEEEEGDDSLDGDSEGGESSFFLSPLSQHSHSRSASSLSRPLSDINVLSASNVNALNAPMSKAVISDISLASELSNLGLGVFHP